MHGFRLQFRWFIAGITATALATVPAFLVPIVIQYVLDVILMHREAPPFPFIGIFSVLERSLGVPVVAIVSLTSISGAFSFLAGRWSSIGAERGAESLRLELYRHIHRVSVAYHAEASRGDLLQRCTSDIETVRKFFALQVIEIGRALSMVLLAVPLMVCLNGNLTLVAVALLPVAFGYTTIFFIRVQQTFLASDEAEGTLSAVLQEHIAGISVVRAFAAEPREMERFSEKNGAYRDITMRLLMLLARYWMVSSIVVLLQTGALLVAGVMAIQAGTLTVGGLLVFLMLEQMLLWPVQQTGMILADFGKARVAMKRIEEVLTAPVENDDPRLAGSGTKRPPIRGHIVFDNVDFSYQDPVVLRGVSFEIPAGATVGVLGATGSGKSTLSMLLSRLYDPQGGRIFIDGTDLRDIDRSWMRRHLGYVLQEPFLYARTLRDNISFARTSAVEAEIIGAARAAAVHDTIENFSNGYDTLVGEKGVTLSGGQKQRVAIARALLMKTPILIFDDSLSAVDTQTDALIRERLLSNGATTILISHRVTTLFRTDLVLVMEDGRIVEQGTPQKLLDRGGRFANIWNLQQGDYYGERNNDAG